MMNVNMEIGQISSPFSSLVRPKMILPQAVYKIGLMIEGPDAEFFMTTPASDGTPVDVYRGIEGKWTISGTKLPLMQVKLKETVGANGKKEQDIPTAGFLGTRYCKAMNLAHVRASEEYTMYIYFAKPAVLPGKIFAYSGKGVAAMVFKRPWWKPELPGITCGVVI